MVSGSYMIALSLLLLIASCYASSAKYENAADARDYLIKFGYLPPPDPFTGSLVSYEDFQQSIKQFQVMAGLEPTGKIDDKTLLMMNRERCGVSDKLGTSRFSARKKRYNLQGSKWYKNALTYYITGYTNRLQRSAVDSVIQDAFRIWAEHANLVITESASAATADILIAFVNGSHTDSFPFDGKGGVLAHAFFPERGGDTHFDDEEHWSIGDNGHGVDLFFAAVHEFGHSLGLGHSDVSDSIMAPIYRGYVSDLQLADDDIRAIQSLYGKKSAPSLSSTPAIRHDGSSSQPNRQVAVVDSQANLCSDASLDGITTTQDGSTYIFKGIYYWKLNTESRLALDPSYPQKISDDWQGLRGNIDTVYTDYQGRTFFFKGDKYWEFYNKQLLVDAGDISFRFPGLPSNIDAIFIWTGNGKTYAIKGQYYYRLLDNGYVAAGYPRDVTIWAGLPYGKIDAAINFQNFRTYFFSEQNYYRFNDRSLKVDSGYPLPTSSRWLGCISNILSQEGQYNKQWLEVNENVIVTQTYPPDILNNSAATIPLNLVCCIVFSLHLI